MLANLIVGAYALGLLAVICYVVIRGERVRKRRNARHSDSRYNGGMY